MRTLDRCPPGLRPPAPSAILRRVADELEEGLKRRDPRFLIRLGVALAIVLLGGIWGLNELGDANVGGCVARGFGAVTETPPAQD